MLPKFVPRNVLAPALIALVALLLAAGCGDDGGGDETKSLSIEATEPAKDSYAFEAPQSIEAGLADIEFKNSGKLEHEAQLIKIEGNHTIEQALKAFDKVLQGGAAADWFRARGGVGTIAPGASATITQRLEPGSYVILDSGEPEGRDVQPHYRQGAVAELTVTGDATDAKLPDADATITAAEYQFTPSGALKAGKNTIEFRNAGAQWHHLIISRINPGSTIDDVKREIETEKGPPIAEVNAEETAVIDGGEAQLTEVDLTPGSYALLCFIPDRAGGPPHVAKGMISEAKVP
jgi:uncharacterized cupredoxin-like copper-binding protein